MAVADKMEKGESTGGSWLSEAGSLGPRKFNELRSFLTEVRSELKKVTWPAKTEVYATTIVVVVTTVFFGFYLWALDIAFSQAFQALLKR